MSDTAITISSTRVSPLSDQERAAFGFTHKYSVLYSDIAYGSASADTVTLTLGATPAKFCADKAAINIGTAFAGTTALSIQVGTTSDTDNFITAQSVLTAAYLFSSKGPNTVETKAGSTATAAVNLVAVFTNATDGSPSALTAGALDIYLSVNSTATNRLP